MVGDGSFAGRVIGNYRLIERIGEGGMGEVYAAERADSFRKRVAVKLIRSGMAKPEVVRRFVIERQTLAALNHPHIVRLIDGGATEEGLPYLVEDFVEGQPIDQYCDERKLPITIRLKIFREVCLAVHHAHQTLIVHCDLKPGNILVTPEGSPMLLDFGIAKLLDPVTVGISAEAAQTRQRAFTPDYASPEQLRGQPVTTATDIYALGVILYELVSGHSPYKSASTASLADWVKCVCEQDADPPSVAVDRVEQKETEEEGKIETITPDLVSMSREGDPPGLRRRLRGDLDAITLKALRKDPKHRYGSVDQLAEDIERHLKGLPVLARKNTTGYVVQKFLARHKVGVAAAALLLASVLVGVYTTVREARIAAARFEDVRGLAHAFLFDVHDAIQDLPGSTKAVRLIATTGTDYLNRLERDAAGDKRLQIDLAEGYMKVGDVEGNPYDSNLGDTEKALADYRKALAMAQSVVDRNPDDVKARQTLALAHENLGAVLPFRNQLEESLKHARQAVTERQRILRTDPKNHLYEMDLSRAYEVEGDVLGGTKSLNLGRSDEAMAAYNQGLDLAMSLPAGDPLMERALRGRAVFLLKIADLEWREGASSKSIEGYEKGVATAETLTDTYATNTHNRAILTAGLNKLAFAKGATGDLAGAESVYKRCAEVDEAGLAADPSNQKAQVNVSVSRKNLGDLYYYQLNKWADALANYRRAGEMLEIQVRSDPGAILWAQHLSEIEADEGSCLLALDKKDEARAASSKALALAKQVADHAGATADQVYNYAWLLVTVDPEDLQRPKEALPYAQKAVELSHAQDPLILHVLALSYAGQGDYSHAVEALKKAVALFPPADPGKPVPRNRGIVERTLEKYEKELAK